MDTLSIYVRMFNDRVKVMNQSNSSNLTLTAQDARNLHSDIFALLALVAELEGKLQANSEESIEVTMDGGGFK
jgi:hypothetical protein